MRSLPETIGPVVFARGADGHQYRLSRDRRYAGNLNPPALFPAEGQEVIPVRLYSQFDRTVRRYDFDLPARGDATYRWGIAVFPVSADYSGDVRIAYVSCNGQEHADADRPAAERNAMWRRLAAEHARAPFGLLLCGGDQLYADEVLQSHPAIARWAATARNEKTEHALSVDMREAAESHYFHRYLTLYAQPEVAHLNARVPPS